MLQDPKAPMNPKETSLMTHPDASMKMCDINKEICEMQSVSSRIWTRVAESISSDDNHYTIYIYVCVCVCVCFEKEWLFK